MNIAERVIEKFGGLVKMQHALGHKHCTTIQGWKDSGNIPPWRWPEINAGAEREGIDVSEEHDLASAASNAA